MSTIKKTLGGDRLGAGRKMTQEMHGFGRSSHDVGMVFRTDQAIGTIVPAFCQLGTTGTTFYMDIEAKTRTLPTNGPIFGSMKHQIDVFMIPIRLYVGALHNNMLGIGLNMQDVKLPSFQLESVNVDDQLPVNVWWQQISQDSLAAYLGNRYIGQSSTPIDESDPIREAVARDYCALFLMAYWDIYKNYYANKQEGIGYVIGGSAVSVINAYIVNLYRDNDIITKVDAITGRWDGTASLVAIDAGTNYVPTARLRVQTDAETEEEAINIVLNDIILYQSGNPYVWDRQYWNFDWRGNGLIFVTAKSTSPTITWKGAIQSTASKSAFNISRSGIKLNSFELNLIDQARMTVLSKAADYTTPLQMNVDVPYDPYIYTYGTTQNDNRNRNGSPSPFSGNASWFNQAGLGLRTYLSDRFNNWLSTEWIDGTNGINEVTAIQIVDNKLTMDALILQKKIFDMMNRIAISGGSYNDWQEAVYGVQVARMAESPIYMGGASYEIVFDEVVSNSATENEPLGSLAGRGTEGRRKGGRGLRIKCEEPSLIMVLESYVPRVDYSQGNKWWCRLETMNDLHKPNLDAIGFQELVTDEFAALDTQIGKTADVVYKSVGKQVSWQEYMTNVNETFGDFAVGGSLDWMAFNRAYKFENGKGVVDATTYIDPTIFNVAFANSKLSAKNLWTQIAFNATARRVMSAKQIPNL